jgi:hypothetical protein
MCLQQIKKVKQELFAADSYSTKTINYFNKDKKQLPQNNEFTTFWKECKHHRKFKETQNCTKTYKTLQHWRVIFTVWKHACNIENVVEIQAF